MLVAAAIFLTAGILVALLAPYIGPVPRWPERRPRVHCGRCSASYLDDRGLSMHVAAMHVETYDERPGAPAERTVAS